MSVISSLLVKIGVDVDDIQKGIDEGQAALKSGAAKFAVAGGAIGVAVAAGVVGSMNLEKANDKLSAQLGLSAKESERIGDVAGSLYADAYGDSMDDVNNAVGAVMSSIEGMSNASSGRLEAVTAKALDFASAFEIDVQRAAQVAGQAVSTGLAKNATEAFDLITAASQRVPANLREDVLDAADEYGQFFASLGFDGEQAFGTLVEGAEKGMYGIDKAGDAIKEFTIRSTDMSTASKDAYKAIGLNARDMADAILKGGDDAQGATQKIIKGLLNIENPSKRANAAIALFGTPLEDINVKDIPDFLRSMQKGSDAMEGFEGSSKRMGDTLNDNAATNLESFKRQATQTFVDVVGGKVLPAVDKVASKLSTAFGPSVEKVTAFLKDHENIVVPVAAALGTMAGVVATIIGVTKAWTMAQAALNVVMAMNPIGLVVIAIAGLVAGLVVAYKKSETFRKIVDKAFEVVGKAGKWLYNNAIKPAFAGIKDAIEAVAKAGIWLWNKALQPTFQFIIKGVAGLLGMWAKMLRALAKVPGFGWAAKAADVMEGAAGKAREMADGIKKIPSHKSSKITLSVPNMQAVSDRIDWVARPRQSRITLTQTYGAAGRDTAGGLQRGIGGAVTPGNAYEVGEHGREVFVPGVHGAIVASDKLEQMLAAKRGGGGDTYNVYETQNPNATAAAISRRQRMAGVG